MNIFALALFASCIILINSHDSTSSSQQVVVSCPVGPEVSRGLPGVPGKRGIKGELGIPGKQFNVAENLVLNENSNKYCLTFLQIMVFVSLRNENYFYNLYFFHVRKSLNSTDFITLTS